MKLRVSTDGFRLAVLAALGSLGGAACGGSVRSGDDSGGTGGTSGASTGGAQSGGASFSSGGRASGGAGPSTGGVKTAFLEACVGETVAAVEVAEAAERASDPVVVDVLRRIAQDEMQHATLGFRFVRWALGALPSDRRTALKAELRTILEERLSSEARVVRSTCDDRVLVAHGLLSGAVLEDVRVKALEEVVRPCARAAFAAPSS